MCHKIMEVQDKKVLCQVNGEMVEMEGDAVVCALGLQPERTLLEELRENLAGVEIIPIGDVNAPRKIIQAVHEGYHAGRRI